MPSDPPVPARRDTGCRGAGPRLPGAPGPAPALHAPLQELRRSARLRSPSLRRTGGVISPWEPPRGDYPCSWGSRVRGSRVAGRGFAGRGVAQRRVQKRTAGLLTPAVPHDPVPNREPANRENAMSVSSLLRFVQHFLNVRLLLAAAEALDLERRLLLEDVLAVERFHLRCLRVLLLCFGPRPQLLFARRLGDAGVVQVG